MAKESVKARQRKREKMVAKFAEKRAALKAAGDWGALDQLPRNSSKVRLKNRCKLTGRPRGYIRYFGISRVTFRDMALAGKIPGGEKGKLVMQYVYQDNRNKKRLPGVRELVYPSGLALAAIAKLKNFELIN